ncbi:unnamed protein product [Withania somnifera]
MAAGAPPADPADLLQNLSLDSRNKTCEVAEQKKKPSVSPKDAANDLVQSMDRSVTPLLPEFMDPNLCYVPNSYPSTAYYYGYDASANEWEDYAQYVNPDGVEIPGVYGDNGSLIYHHGYGYAPYGPYSPATSPVPAMGHDGQFYGSQQYHYPYFQPLPSTSTSNTTTASLPKGEMATSAAAADQALLSVDSANGNSNVIANGGVKGNAVSMSVRPAFQNSSLNANGFYGLGTLPGGVALGYQDPRLGFDGVRSPIPWIDGSIFTEGQARPVTSNSFAPSFSNGYAAPSSKSQNVHPHVMGLHHPRPLSGVNTTNGYMSRIYPNKYYGHYANTFNSGMGFVPNRYDSCTRGRGWMTVDNKFKTRGRGNSFYGYGSENTDGLNELNRGPRGKGSKNQKCFSPVALAVKGQNILLAVTKDTEKDKTSLIPDKDQYNHPDFPVVYAAAKFFIIKSYSEDDVHKSIKYNVWASTPNGNKKLDAAYQESQQNSGGCPVFLFFSVNTSGQFVGVAEMVGPVDFNKNVEYWQQDKWIGCFPVKWHIVKDVPNSLLKHITLENNENKPVTNSRDTQEVKMEQGLQVLKILKDHISKQCILDDFEFYEDRQKRIQEKKAKQQLLPKQVWEGKAIEENRENSKIDLESQKSSEVFAGLNKENSQAAQTTIAGVKLTENLPVTKSGDDVKGC